MRLPLKWAPRVCYLNYDFLYPAEIAVNFSFAAVHPSVTYFDCNFFEFFFFEDLVFTF